MTVFSGGCFLATHRRSDPVVFRFDQNKTVLPDLPDTCWLATVAPGNSIPGGLAQGHFCLSVAILVVQTAEAGSQGHAQGGGKAKQESQLGSPELDP